MKPQAELPPQGASMPGTPSSRGPSSSGGPESARTSPASTPRPTGTPLAGDLLPAGCASSSGYLWTGQTRASIPHLEPGAIAEVPLQVALLAPLPSTCCEDACSPGYFVVGADCKGSCSIGLFDAPLVRICQLVSNVLNVILFNCIAHCAAGYKCMHVLQVLMFGPGQYQLTDYALFWTFLDGSMNSAQLGPPILLDIEQM